MEFLGIFVFKDTKFSACEYKIIHVYQAQNSIPRSVSAVLIIKSEIIGHNVLSNADVFYLHVRQNRHQNLYIDQ